MIRIPSVLQGCDFSSGGGIDAYDWAELIVRIDATPSAIQVATPDRSSRVEELDIAYSEPEITEDGDIRTVTFFATGIDFGDVYGITSTLDADGVATIAYDELAIG